MSFTLLGILNSQAAGASVSYWLATLGGNSPDVGKSVASDSLGNFYALGYSESSGAGANDFLLTKFDLLGAIQWQRSLGGTSDDDGNSVQIDSSDNIYAFGRTRSSGAGSNDFLLAKYNTSGTLQWQRTLGGSGYDFGTSVSVDSSGNIYVLGLSDSSGAGSYDFLLAKYNSSGTIQWQRTLGGASQEFGRSLSVDSSGNVYVAGVTTSAGLGQEEFLLAKYNASGTIQWQRIFGGTADDQNQALFADSSGNTFLLGSSNSVGAGGQDLILAKYNTSGTLQWQQMLGGVNTDIGRGVALDSADNIFVSGQTNSSGAGGNDFLLAKYNSSGVIQWQRTLGSNQAEISYGLALNLEDAIYATGLTERSGKGTQILLAKVPSDGSKTGTYSLDGLDMVYAASSLTAGTSTLTSSTSSLTSATSTLTSSTSSLTSATSTLTAHIVEL